MNLASLQVIIYKQNETKLQKSTKKHYVGSVMKNTCSHQWNCDIPQASTYEKYVKWKRSMREHCKIVRNWMVDKITTILCYMYFDKHWLNNEP